MLHRTDLLTIGELSARSGRVVRLAVLQNLGLITSTCTSGNQRNMSGPCCDAWRSSARRNASDCRWRRSPRPAVDRLQPRPTGLLSTSGMDGSMSRSTSWSDVGPARQLHRLRCCSKCTPESGRPVSSRGPGAVYLRPIQGLTGWQTPSQAAHSVGYVTGHGQQGGNAYGGRCAPCLRSDRRADRALLHVAPSWRSYRTDTAMRACCRATCGHFGSENADVTATSADPHRELAGQADQCSRPGGARLGCRRR